MKKYSLYIFDIDGTLVTTVSGDTFRRTADDWKPIGRRLEIVKTLSTTAKIAIASNQAGVAFAWSRFSEAEMQVEIEKVALLIGASYVGVCYSTPNPRALPQYRSDDTRRKPHPGMLLEAMSHRGVDPSETLMIGDRDEDRAAAGNAGCDFANADEFFSELKNSPK